MNAPLRIPAELIGNTSLESINVTKGATLLQRTEQEAYELFREAVESIKLIKMKYIPVIASSFGKDSTVVTLAALQAHIELIEDGLIPQDSPFVVSNIDTGVENHLVQMLVMYEIDRLHKFATKHSINIDIRQRTPPLAKQWSSLFLSGLKIISAARLNNDCSAILKVDNAAAIEKQIKSDYKGNVVTLLGSRLHESQKRAASIKKYKNDSKTADDIVQLDGQDKVFAPIVNMTDDHVWTILRRAGTEPLQSTSASLPNIFSYAKNHRLLHIIYSDSKDGSCPTSSKRIAGTSESLGGCGGSARTGCYLCAKSITDHSGTAQIKQKRHAVISSKILKIRNYVMHISQDVNFRTWHTRAIDETTGAIALQPNVLNAETIDKLLWLLCQVTHDDFERAQKFRKLVAQGRENEDEGYQDIMGDVLLSKEDRHELASVYREYAQHHLIKPMSLEIAIYLSVIHARDGVKLPPYRSLHVWHATSQGKRIPYPEVDLSQIVVSDIPDAVMAVPSSNVPLMQPFSLSNLFDLEHAGGCDANSKLETAAVPVKIAKLFLPDTELSKLDNKKPSDLVKIAGLSEVTLVKKLRKKAVASKRPNQYSKRAIKQCSRKNGQLKVISRGRTSVGSASFKLRTDTPNLEKKIVEPVKYFLPTEYRKHGQLANTATEDCYGYDIDFEAMINWDQFDGSESALRKHDNFVELHQKWDDSIFYYGGFEPFEHFLRWGVIKLNEKSKKHAIRILNRTAYFNSLGLLSIDDSAVVDVAMNQKSNIVPKDISHYRQNIKAKVELHIADVMAMPDYRKYKAKHLLDIRKSRNSKRNALRSEYRDFWAKPNTGCQKQLEAVFSTVSTAYAQAIEEMVITEALLKENIKHFDSVDFYNKFYTARGTVRYIDMIFTDSKCLFNLIFDSKLSLLIATNAQLRLTLEQCLAEKRKKLAQIKSVVLKRILADLKGSCSVTYVHYLTGYNETVRAHVIQIAEQKMDEQHNQLSVFKRTFKLSDTVVSQVPDQPIIW